MMLKPTVSSDEENIQLAKDCEVMMKGIIHDLQHSRVEEWEELRIIHQNY